MLNDGEVAMMCACLDTFGISATEAAFLKFIWLYNRALNMLISAIVHEFYFMECILMHSKNTKTYTHDIHYSIICNTKT